MAERVVRINNVTIKNFKNVVKGNIRLSDKRDKYKSSILGLYGQNGSGKTALIDVIQLLKYALSGSRIPSKYADYIYVGAEYATLEYEMTVEYSDALYKVWYQFCLKKAKEETDVDGNLSLDEGIRVELINEKLSFSYESQDVRIRKNTLIDTESNALFSPKVRVIDLLGDKKEGYMDLLVTKKIAKATSRSFVFSRELVNQYRRRCQNNIYLNLIEALYYYAHRELFVIDTQSIGLISLNALPLVFKYKNDTTESVGRIIISLDATTSIPEDADNVVENVIDNMNIVLEQLIPGLRIGVADLGFSMNKDGQVEKQIQLLSLKNNKSIPFRYESEGIKKIVSILQLLIVVYNHSSITVAIDELDGGVFEYLLGELLRIIADKGKGQLVFTSHNLRPLETLDKKFIAFTTTNIYNRYIRLSNVKGTNNLRDFYYRDIVLGEQNEQVYNPTNNSKIALAFSEAGEAFGA